MVYSSRQRLHYAFHLQLEEQSRETADGDASLHGDDVELEVVGLL